MNTLNEQIARERRELEGYRHQIQVDKRKQEKDQTKEENHWNFLAGKLVSRYFNCTGKTHKRTCTGPKVTIYAEEFENMVYDCISEKLADLKGVSRAARKDTGEANDLKLRIKAIEKAEQQLMDTMLAGGFNEDLLALANQKAAQLKRDKQALYDRLDDLKSRDDEADVAVNLARSWRTADYSRRKAVAGLMIHKIVISEDGGAKILWNI